MGNLCIKTKKHHTNYFLQTMAYHAHTFDPQVKLLLVLCLHLWWNSTSATGEKKKERNIYVYIFHISKSASDAQTPLVGCCPKKSHLGKVFRLIRFVSNTITVTIRRGIKKQICYGQADRKRLPIGLGYIT